MTYVRPRKNNSQRLTFEMSHCGGDAEHVWRSTTHDTYGRAQASVVGTPCDDKEKKRKELEEHLWKTMTEKVLHDMAEKTKNHYAQNNQFKTTYSTNFQIKGFRLREIGEQLNEELCAKYPLYNTTGMSLNRYECNKAKQPVHKPLVHLFKKDSRFTSYMSNPNDYHAPVAAGHFAFV